MQNTLHQPSRVRNLESIPIQRSTEFETVNQFMDLHELVADQLADDVLQAVLDEDVQDLAHKVELKMDQTSLDIVKHLAKADPDKALFTGLVANVIYRLDASRISKVIEISWEKHESPDQSFAEYENRFTAEENQLFDIVSEMSQAEKELLNDRVSKKEDLSIHYEDGEERQLRNDAEFEVNVTKKVENFKQLALNLEIEDIYKKEDAERDRLENEALEARLVELAEKQEKHDAKAEEITVKSNIIRHKMKTVLTHLGFAELNTNADIKEPYTNIGDDRADWIVPIIDKLTKNSRYKVIGSSSPEYAHRIDQATDEALGKRILDSYGELGRFKYLNRHFKAEDWIVLKELAAKEGVTTEELVALGNSFRTREYKTPREELAESINDLKTFADANVEKFSNFLSRKSAKAKLAAKAIADIFTAE